MDKKIEGIIKNKYINNLMLYYEIEYINDGKKLRIGTVPYSHLYSDKYKKGDLITFEFNEDGNGIIIDDELVEVLIEKNSFKDLCFIILFLFIFVVAIIDYYLYENIFVYFIGFLILILVLFLIIFCFQFYKKKTILKGKIISKKEVILPNSVHKFRLQFNILCNNKIYCITDRRYTFVEKLKVNDDVEIAVYNNIAIWARDLKQKKGINYRALPLLLLFISLIVYVFKFVDKMKNNLLYFIPFIVLFILLFLCSLYASNDKKKKK